MVTVVRVVFYSGSADGQYVLDGKVVEKVRLVGAVYLVDWLEGQCGQVVGILASSSQDDIDSIAASLFVWDWMS